MPLIGQAKLDYMKRYRAANLERERKRSKDWSDKPENKASRKIYNKKYQAEHPEECKRNGENYRKRDPERKKEMARIRAKRHRDKGLLKQRHAIRYASDVQYNLAVRLRNRIRMAFHKAKNGARKHDCTIKLLGCSYDEFRKHIESKFTFGMSWQEVLEGKIHIDHIKPISSFDLTDPLQQKLAFSFQNCQPLWAAENLEKGCKIIPFEQQKIA